MTILCLAVDASRSFLNAAFCTGPSTVRPGSLIAARQPGGGFVSRKKKNGNEFRSDGGSVGPRSVPRVGLTQLDATSALLQDRSSRMKYSTSEPHLNFRYSGSPAHDGS